MNSLAHKRKQILQQMEQIDRMEYGSLQQESRPSQRSPGQTRGPYFKHQVWEQGQNQSRRVPADQATALNEAIEGRKEFELLANQFIDTTVAMTRAEGSLDSKKKTDIEAAVQAETAGFIEQFLNRPPTEQHLQELELTVRDLLLKAGTKLLEPVVQFLADQFDASFEPGPPMRWVDRRPLEVQGLFGSMQMLRDYYFDGQSGHCPADAALALEVAYTPALARLACRAAAQNSYREASRDLFEYAGITVSERQIERVVQRIAPAVGPWLQTQQIKPEMALMYVSGDGTGVPMRKEVLVGRKGKQPDGSAKTREAKLGCVFLQTEVDAEGHPVRKEESTSYIGSFEEAAAFGLLLRQEAQRRGLAQATKVIFIGDGAAWVWELTRVNFPGAILILDFYHALQHVHGLVEALWGKESAESKKHLQLWKRWLFKDQAVQIIKQAKGELERSLDTEKAGKEIGYLENNLERMTYGTFRKAGYFIGSGVVEAGCKTVVGKRMKNSGMFWSEDGGQGILDLRCTLLSDRLGTFCQARAASHKARNDPLKIAA
jgi:hypothetical protein